MKRTALVLALAVSGCLQPSAPEAVSSGAAAPVPSPLGRELGTLSAIYPMPMVDGSYALELQMTRDTVLVDLGRLQEFASDSAGKALLRSTAEPFYTLNEKCFYNPKKEACLDFRQASRDDYASADMPAVALAIAPEE